MNSSLAPLNLWPRGAVCRVIAFCRLTYLTPRTRGFSDRPCHVPPRFRIKAACGSLPVRWTLAAPIHYIRRDFPPAEPPEGRSAEALTISLSLRERGWSSSLLTDFRIRRVFFCLLFPFSFGGGTGGSLEIGGDPALILSAGELSKPPGVFRPLRSFLQVEPRELLLRGLPSTQHFSPLSRASAGSPNFLNRPNSFRPRPNMPCGQLSLPVMA